MTQKEFKQWVSELPEENDNAVIAFKDRYEDLVLVEDYGTGSYWEEGSPLPYIQFYSWTIIK